MTDPEASATQPPPVRDDVRTAPVGDAPHGRRRRRRRLALVVIVGFLTFFTAVVLGGIAAWQALQVRQELVAAQTVSDMIATDLRSLRVEQAAARLPELQEHTSGARRWATTGVLPLGAHVPVVGDDVAAVRSAAIAVDDVAHEAMPPLVSVAQTMDPESLAPQGGRIAVQPLVAARDPLARASEALGVIQQDLAPIDVESLNGRVAPHMQRLIDGVTRLRATTGDAHDIVRVAPGFLGADGPRDILVLFQNNAEVRSRGGISGAAAVLRADDGRIELRQQLSSTTVGPFAEPVVPLGDSEELYGDRLGKYIQNVTLTPDFPLSAELAIEMWRRGEHPPDLDVSAVIAVDPVALSYLLKASGPVPVPNGVTLTPANAVQKLLNEPYLTDQSPAQMDAFFAAAAASAFETILGKASGRQAVGAMGQALSERRVLLWSARAQEQEVLVGRGVAGAFNAEQVGPHDVGVFLNSATASKLGYYLRQSISSSPWCAASGESPAIQGAQLSLTLESAAPADIASAPRYLSGTGAEGIARGTDMILVYFYGAPGVSFDAMRLNGQPVGSTQSTDRGLVVSVVPVALPPGETATVTVFARGVDHRQITLQTTPLASKSSQNISRECNS